MGTIVRTNYEPPKLKKCPDCGENLVKPHPLGAHIPGCSLDFEEKFCAPEILARVKGSQ